MDKKQSKKEYTKIYYDTHKVYFNILSYIYARDHPEKIKERYQRNKEKISQKNKEKKKLSKVDYVDDDDLILSDYFS